MSQGYLQFAITNENNEPISAKADIYGVSGESSPIDSTISNESGKTISIPLSAPSIDYSLEPDIIMPYSEYSAIITSEGFAPVVINNINIFAENLSIIKVILSQDDSVINIGPHVLYGNYPPKIPEAEIKPVTDKGEIVLDKVVIPESIIVHDGAPTDTTANNYTVPFTEYIKNVASSEIYPTWPKETLKANILAIISFTLNRVYTEWYRNKGYYFTITSTTAFDHKWIRGRNIFETISQVVDEIFTNYISKPNVKQPIFTQYCDGKKTTCSGLSQWGSKALGDQGLSAIQILRNYYGSDIYINSAEQVDGIPISYPGIDLEIGSSGTYVRTIQEQLNLIRKTYSEIPEITIDGIYGNNTRNAVKKFQEIFNQPQTGVVGYSTWYKISQLYVALAKLSA